MMLKMAFFREGICEYELKNNSIYFEIVYCCQIQLDGLIEEPGHGSTGFKKSIPSQVLTKISTLVKVFESLYCV